MKIIAIMNQKGGVGKTTTTVNLAAALVRAGKKVLLIDADLQSNATVALGVLVHQKNDITCDLLALLMNQCVWQDALLTRTIQTAKQKRAHMDIIPATVALSGFDQIVRALPNKQILLHQLLHELKLDYDYIFIDCPPSLGLMTINALVAAHEVIIPVLPEFFALQGLSQLLDTVKLLQTSLNPSLKIGGIVCVRCNRRKIHQEIIACLQDRFDSVVFATKIHENIAIAEAPSFGKTIFEYQEHSVGSYDFELLAKEFMNREIRQMKLPLTKTGHKELQL